MFFLEVAGHLAVLDMRRAFSIQARSAKVVSGFAPDRASTNKQAISKSGFRFCARSRFNQQTGDQQKWFPVLRPVPCGTAVLASPFLLA
ncbi:hypothetical protein [Mesorhizobium sp. J8]|uniref:hypothetical protein n=1 Tax=Mesorhizobium sp. J8 TaxID=2777475 RepID=UPI00191642A8|nr:hypothetical protein [Mesorhizobium sp. J8]